jgi:tetratricopeptide (TPR) repeat protein
MEPKRSRVLIGKGPVVLILVLTFAIGGLGGFALVMFFDPFSVPLADTPFSPDTRMRIKKGRDFLGLAELRKLPQADRDKHLEGLRLAKAGKYEEALERFSAVAAAHRDFAPALGCAALMRLRALQSNAGDTAAAAEAVAAALAADGGHPWIQYVAGLYWEALGSADSAEDRYRSARSLSPQFAYPYLALGRLRLARGEISAAEGNFRMAIGLMETAPEAYKSEGERAIPVTEAAPFDLLADLYYQKGAEDSALMALESGEEKGWKTDRMSLIQGRLWEARGFLGKADSVYKLLVAKDPGNREYAEAQATLGWKPVRSETGPGAAVFALSLLDPLARQNPRNAPLWLALGQAYYHRGLFGMATDCFDSSLKYDPAYPGVAAKRNLAFEAWMRANRAKTNSASQARRDEAAKPAVSGTGKAAAPRTGDGPLSPEEQTPVIIPGSIALLGTYSVPWGSSPEAVRHAYPRKEFRQLPGGNLMDSFLQEGWRHEYVLAFKDGKLWGVRVFVTDSAGVGGDVFGRMIRTKTKISGEGKGTGEASCPGFRPFQGVIWETDDTFEFMAQFTGKENQVRLVRMDREHLPANHRLCDLVPYLNAETWQ